ncbi:hypothetical protein Lser_V15G35324 [Lactuca serriola]
MFPDVHETESEKIVYTYNIDDLVMEESQSSGQCMTNMEDSIAAVEAILKYKFNNKSLLEAALTHSSYSGSHSQSYQRLELLGDSVLGLVIANVVYLAYPDLDPGQISNLRAANISNEKLARVAVCSGLYKYVRHKNISLNDKVREFVIAVEEEDGMVVYGGKMKAPKVLADIVGSVAGAVYEDCGFNLQILWVVSGLDPIHLFKFDFRNQLYKYIRHKTIDLNDKVREFVIAVEEDEMVDYGEQMKAPKVLADIVESVAGAVYEDCGFNLQKLWVVIRELLEPMIMLNVLEKQSQPVTMIYEACEKEGKIVDTKKGRKEKKENVKLHAAEVALSNLTRLKSTDAVSLHMDVDCGEATEIKGAKLKIHQFCNRRKWPKGTYRIEQELGPAHNRRYIASVQIELSDKIFFTKGEERSKVKAAENSAASIMFSSLRDLGY